MSELRKEALEDDRKSGIPWPPSPGAYTTSLETENAWLRRERERLILLSGKMAAREGPRVFFALIVGAVSGLVMGLLL